MYMCTVPSGPCELLRLWEKTAGWFYLTRWNFSLSYPCGLTQIQASRPDTLPSYQRHLICVTSSGNYIRFFALVRQITFVVSDLDPDSYWYRIICVSCKRYVMVLTAFNFRIWYGLTPIFLCEVLRQGCQVTTSLYITSDELFFLLAALTDVYDK